MRTNASLLERIWAVMYERLPEFSDEEGWAAVTLYRELAKGEPVSAEQFARALPVPPARAQELLERPSIKTFVYPDDQGRVLGFGGLAAAPMHHKSHVGERTLWTWCAGDSLFIPGVLGAPARVESPDPETGELVRLTVSPDRIESAHPTGAVVSFPEPGAEGFPTSSADVLAMFCRFIFFFASQASGERWAAKHEGTHLLALGEGFELARRFSTRSFGNELARRASL